jgi:hypothetical protein
MRCFQGKRLSSSAADEFETVTNMSHKVNSQQVDGNTNVEIQNAMQ